MEEARRWLCPTELDRARVVEASARVRRARTVAAGAVGIALVASAPWIGHWTLALFAIAVLNLATLEWRFARSKRPERVAMGSLLLILTLLAAGAALSGGPDSPILPWLVIPAAMGATRFRRPVVFAFAGLTAVVMVAVGVAVDPQAVAENPVALLASLVLMVSTAAVCSALMGAEMKHRDAAVLDPLTGLLNRSALRSRVAELEQQARLTGDSVCFVACDIDGFKRVNDTYGHERGDAVLRGTAYQLRKALRSFELIYRIGGEEFLVVLPGATAEGGVDVAERLRSHLAQARPGDLELTMSFGVDARSGQSVAYETLFRAADAALYEAKRAGRNRVVASRHDVRPEALPEPAAAIT
jgi:diguanylate cyclase (GGDEF)-like protein